MAKIMKDSGVEWIGEIPSDWQRDKLGHVFNIIGSGTTPRISNDVFYEGTVNWIQSGDINGGYITECKNKIHMKYVDECPGLKIYSSPFIAVAMYGASVGNIAISQIDACVNQACCVFADTKAVFKFTYYAIKSAKDYLILMSVGGGQPNISQEILRNLKIPLPSIDEQNKISGFLEAKCTKIDKIIFEARELIEDYKKYKQSLITETVTRGLNPISDTRDGGINWIGQIPKYWQIIKIKFTSWLKGRIGWQGLKSSEYTDEGPYLITGTDFCDGYINWDTCVHISEKRYEEAPEIHIKEDDLLITKDGTIGKVAIARNCPEKVSLNSGVLLIRNVGQYKYHDKYLYYVLLSDVFWTWYENSQAGHSTIRHLYQEQFYDFSYPYPPLDEQRKISEYLDAKCAEIDKLIAAKEALIEDLEAYKKSLIYEYITGKREVI